MFWITRVRCFSSSSYDLTVCSMAMMSPPLPRLRRRSAEAAGDVLLRLFFRRIGEDLLGHAVFHQFAQIHEGGEIGGAGGLLHVVGDDDDAVVALQLVD